MCGDGQSFHTANLTLAVWKLIHCRNVENTILPYNWLKDGGAGNTDIPTDDEVKDFLSGINQTPAFVYLCRCGSHMRIVKAIQQAAQEQVGRDASSDLAARVAARHSA